MTSVVYMVYTKAYVEKIDKDEITAIASSSVEDRQGEIVDVSGWDLSSFKAAPRLLWGHDHQKLPIGKVTKIWVQKSTDRLMFKAVFQEVTEMGRAVKKLFEQGFLNTFSVGFKPIDSEHDPDTKSGTRYTKQELLEISVVNVPANPQAMTLAYKSLEEDGLEGEANKIFGESTVFLMNEMDSVKERLAKAEELAESAVKGLQFLNPHNGRSREAKQRAFMLKVIAKAADKELTVRKGDEAKRIRIIKQATDQLILANKENL